MIAAFFEVPCELGMIDSEPQPSIDWGPPFEQSNWEPPSIRQNARLPDLTYEADGLILTLELNSAEETARLSATAFIPQGSGRARQTGVWELPSQIFHCGHYYRLTDIPALRMPAFTSPLRSALRIPNTVEHIGKHVCEASDLLTAVAFEEPSCLRVFRGFAFTLLEAIEIPSSVESIASGALADCHRLRHVTFPPDSRLQFIDGFERSALARFEVPDSVVQIGPNAFADCAALDAVVFSRQSHLKVIAGFCGCPFREFWIPPAVQRIEIGAFRDCLHLCEVRLPQPSHLWFIGGFQRCGLREFWFPASLREIGDFAFADCEWLEQITMARECQVVAVLNTLPQCFIGFSELALKRTRAHILDEEDCWVSDPGAVAVSRPKPPRRATLRCLQPLGDHPDGASPGSQRGNAAAGDPSHSFAALLASTEVASILVFGFTFSDELKLVIPRGGPFLPRFTPSKPLPVYCLTQPESGSWVFLIDQLAALLLTLPFLEVDHIRQKQNAANHYHFRLLCQQCQLQLFHVETCGLHTFQMDLTSGCPCLCRLLIKSTSRRDFLPSRPIPDWSGRGQVAPDRVRPPLQRCYDIDCTARWPDLRDPESLPYTDSISRVATADVHHGRVDPLQKKWCDDVRFSERTWRQVRAQQEANRDFDSIVEKLKVSGSVTIRLGAVIDEDHPQPRGSLGYNAHVVIGLTWVSRRAPAAFDAASYIQLDCSFKPSYPYSYCTPQAIINNEAIPLGFIMTPTEREATFAWFYQDLELMHGGTLPPKPILSDRGLGLIAFGLHIMAHFFCYRHLIENFGARGLLGILVTRVLRLPSEDAFRAALQEVVDEADLLLSNERITDDDHKCFIDFLGGRDGSEYRHGRWLRIRYGVSTCSNHAERFHRTVNKRTKGKQILLVRLAILVDAINEKIDRYQDGRFRQLRYVIKTLRQKNAPQDLGCQREKCRHFRAEMQSRFGIKFCPCKHQAAHEQFDKIRGVAPIPLVPCTGAFEVKVYQLEGEELDWAFPAARVKVDKARDLDLKVPRALAEGNDRQFTVQIVREVSFLLNANKRFQGDQKFSFLMEVAHAVRDTKGARPIRSDFCACFSVHAWQWAVDRNGGQHDIGFYCWMREAMR
jgi:hypothetical protein